MKAVPLTVTTGGLDILVEAKVVVALVSPWMVMAVA